jgi:hypothetical protein
VTTPWWRSPALLVCLGTLAYACVVTYPMVFQFDRTIYGYPGDATGTVAAYSWWSYAIRHHLSIFDNTLWGAPYGAGWQIVPFPVIPVLLLAPFSGLVGGTVTYNVEVLASFPLTGWATYLLARRIGCTPLGAAFSAFAFTFSPYHIEKAQGHAGQTHMEFFAGTLLFLLRWRQGGSRWNLIAAGAVAGLTLWDDFYYAFIGVFLVATFFVVSYLHRRFNEPSAPSFRSHLVGTVIVALVTLLFLPLAVLLAFRPSNGSVSSTLSKQAVTAHQSLAEIQVYSSRPLEFVLPYHDNPLLPDTIRRYEGAHLHGSNFTEQSLFIGYTVMLLAVVAVVAVRPRFITILLLAIGVVGAVVSLPPQLHFGAVGIPMPSLFLNAVAPIFRVYARFGILVLLGAAVLGGLGLTVIQARLKGQAAWLLTVPFLLTALEFNNLPPTHVTQIYPAPAEYQWLATQPTGTLIEYPLQAGTMQEQEIQTRQYTLYQQAHGHPIFNGATAASHAHDLYPQLEPYYGAGVAGMLRQIGIRYVFVHRDDYQHDGYPLPQDVPGLTYLRTINGVDIYVVT